MFSAKSAPPKWGPFLSLWVLMMGCVYASGESCYHGEFDHSWTPYSFECNFYPNLDCCFNATSDAKCCEYDYGPDSYWYDYRMSLYASVSVMIVIIIMCCVISVLRRREVVRRQNILSQQPTETAAQARTAARTGKRAPVPYQQPGLYPPPNYVYPNQLPPAYSVYPPQGFVYTISHNQAPPAYTAEAGVDNRSFVPTSQSGPTTPPNSGNSRR